MSYLSPIELGHVGTEGFVEGEHMPPSPGGQHKQQAVGLAVPEQDVLEGGAARLVGLGEDDLALGSAVSCGSCGSFWPFGSCGYCWSCGSCGSDP